ncbi:MAG TPA: phosphoribosylanthranilate isomerase [Rhizomicrobium sp.]|jgi:phosphoribosylanthranilate isomerase
MLIQIYEITSPDEARALSEMGVDHIGVLVGDGTFPREQSIESTRAIFAAVHSGSKRCALSLATDLSFIGEIVTRLRPDILHLACAPELLGPSDVLALRAAHPDLSTMRSIPVIDESSIALARTYDGVANFLLLDSYRAGDRQIGALGTTHEWGLDRRIVESVNIPVIIAGGLGPENVAAAIAASCPAGADSKTGTDKADGTHTKDLVKVCAFIAAARSGTIHKGDHDERLGRA